MSAWCDALPDSLRDTATAEALQTITISISTNSPQLFRLVATGETDTVTASDNQQRQSTQRHTKLLPTTITSDNDAYQA